MVKSPYPLGPYVLALTCQVTADARLYKRTEEGLSEGLNLNRDPMI